MPDFQYREATVDDLPAMARIRAEDWETEEYWMNRISGYLTGDHNPQQALGPRIIYVALDGEVIAGFIAGHLTQRYACSGELEWINVIESYKRKGIASNLFRLLASWFIFHKAYRVCVDVDPTNLNARKFYKRHSATELNKYWLVWDDIRGIRGEEKDFG